MRNRDVNWI